MHCFGYTLMTSTICAELDPGAHMWSIQLPFLNWVWQSAGTWKDFLPESEGLGGAGTLASAGRLLVGGGTERRRVWSARMMASKRSVCGANLARALQSTSLQLLFCKHSQLKQLVDSVKLLIIHYVLNIVPQTRVKMTNRILSSLYYAAMHQTLLKLTIIVLYRLISLF
jgi:hypothetical protein